MTSSSTTTTTASAAPAEAPEFQTRYSFYNAKDYHKDPEEEEDNDVLVLEKEEQEETLAVVSEPTIRNDNDNDMEKKETPNDNTDDPMDPATSPSSAQEILKSLQETEQIIWKNPPPALHERELSQVSTMVQTGVDQDRPEAAAAANIMNTSNHSHMEAHEQALREALYWVRIRSQRRLAALRSQRETTFMETKPLLQKQEEDTNETLQQPPECNTRRAEMAQEVEKLTVELGRVSTSGSQSTIPNPSNHNHNNAPPLPLAPISSTTTPHTATKPPLVVTATALDNQLLSPAANVRKAVEGSTPELFRGTCSSSSPSSRMATEEEENHRVGLELANPVLSQHSSVIMTPVRNPDKSTAPHTPTTANSMSQTHPPPPPSASSSRLFSVVPSSPAPHNFGTTPTTGGTLANPTGTKGITTTTNTSSSHPSNGGGTAPTTELETAEMRRTRLELERQWRLEEEIERGVEHVLIAILEKATQEQQQQQDGIGSLPYAVDKSIPGEDDLIHRAFSNLFSQESGGGGAGGGVGSSVAPTMRLARVASTEEGEKGSSNEKELGAVQASGKSIVDELLAEPDTDDFGETSMNLQGCEDETSPTVETGGAPQAPTELNDSLLSLTISSDPERDDYDVSASIRPFTNAYDEILEVEAVEKATNEESLIEDPSDDIESQEKSLDDDNENEYNGRVLGPLSKEVGGTTGVVLQNEEDTDPIEDILSAYESGSGPMDASADSEDHNDEKKSHSIIESITHAVRKGPGDIIAAFSGDSTSVVASPTSVNSEDSGNHLTLNKSSALLIRHLYAHILPVTPGVPKRKKTHKKSSSFSTWFSDYVIGQNMSHAPMHEWDDDDPDEPGYTIHTLSRAQLQHIEHEFESMMNHFDQRPKSSEQSRSTISKDLEDDLKAAETLLSDPVKKERIEKKKPLRKNSVKKGTPTGRSSPTRKAGSKQKPKTTNPLASNPCFPSAKPAGTGEVGDLELYHLPIIYKANQTGFEPTKDLVLQPDTVFAGKYYVQSELGSAAFSTAYRCVDLNSGKKGDDGEMYYDEVCLKVIKNTKDFFDQSLDEIKILELLRQTNKCHENNILEMKTFFYHKEHLIIVTELLRQNLFEFGKYIMENDEPRYFTRQRLCYIARQCLVALTFVHKLELVHSDIKPENILLASYSRAKVKVIDFGSSCYLSDRQSSYIQSRSYRAPEVVLGLPYSGKIDIWSLGCVIAEMYTGQVTFQNDSIVSMLSRIEAICGAFPRHMIESGRQSGQFFTQSGLLYERVTGDEDSEMDATYQGEDDTSLSDSSLFHIFQPKQTTMAARLGFDPNLLDKRRTSWEEDDRALFVDFVQKLLTIDPAQRPTADEALQHPWILSGYNLTEEELKYPPNE